MLSRRRRRQLYSSVSMWKPLTAMGSTCHVLYEFVLQCVQTSFCFIRGLWTKSLVWLTVLVLQEMKRDALSRHVVTRVMVLVTVSASLLDSSTYTSTATTTEESDVETRPGNFQSWSTLWVRSHTAQSQVRAQGIWVELFTLNGFAALVRS